MLERRWRKGRTDVTFVLPGEAPPGPVSVVGDLNDGEPGVHTLRPREDGGRAVTVDPPSDTAQSFRYLAAGDYWFNDETAGEREGAKSRLRT